MSQSAPSTDAPLAQPNIIRNPQFIGTPPGELRMLGYCAACDLELSLGFNGAGETFFYASQALNALPIAACPQCSAALRSETVLSPAARDTRDDRRLIEQMTGVPYQPLVQHQARETGVSLCVDKRARKAAAADHPTIRPSPPAETWAGGDLKWCKACNSFHVPPRDEAHWVRLRCFAPNPFRSARRGVAA